MDHHTVAAISIAGSCLDVLGSLYLAYDLLGGQHGPLRLLTRLVTYSIGFGVGYGLGLTPFFGLILGIASGVTVALELNRVARGLAQYSLLWQSLFSAIRGIAVGLGLVRIVGVEFATIFAILVTVGQVAGYARGISPSMDYSPSRRPRLTRKQFQSTVIRSVSYFGAALACSVLVHHVNWAFAIQVGLVTGIVTGVGQTMIPYVEYYANNLPERRLGVFGIALIFCGFALQSLQYWLALFDVRLS